MAPCTTYVCALCIHAVCVACAVQACVQGVCGHGGVSAQCDFVVCSGCCHSLPPILSHAVCH